MILFIEMKSPKLFAFSEKLWTRILDSPLTVRKQQIHL